MRTKLATVFVLAGLLHAVAATPTVRIGSAAARGRVPSPLRQGSFLPPQSVSAVDVSADGRFVAATTMAFRHDRNFWLLSADGKVLWCRYVLPWAPFQVATKPNGNGFAVGLAYSRVTEPQPTIAEFQDATTQEAAFVDALGDFGWLRYGSGDWRTGWLVSMIGDLIVGARSGLFSVSIASREEPRREPVLLQRHQPINERPYRMTASADGQVLAYGHLVADNSGADAATKRMLRRAPGLLRVRSVTKAADLWTVPPFWEAPPVGKLPDPAAGFPALAGPFNMRPDALVPFRVAASVAVSRDGSRIAATEYGGWLWVRNKPAIGHWDSPYHVVPFIPRQRGWLRVFGNGGRELARAPLPRDGLFDAHVSPQGDVIWCVPISWFARGLAGHAWLPADEKARTLFAFDLNRKSWGTAWQFPDAVSDFAPCPDGERVLVSCWDGWLYLLNRDGSMRAKFQAGGPARLRWSANGEFAIAGTHAGEILCLDANAQLRCKTTLPATELPPQKEPLRPVFQDVPVYSLGRVGPEHAYVGDMWLIKTDQGSIMVDAGGTSSISFTLQRMRAAGVEPKDVRYVLLSHSHGDHCGAAYLWRTMGAKIVAAAPAAFTTGWLMPMLSDYGVWPPRPVDMPLPLNRAGAETDFELCGLRIKAILAPGHSIDQALYLMELNGHRVALTGDIGSEKNDILNRCWGDVEKAKVVTEIVQTRLLPFKPEFNFAGHRARPNATAFLEELVRNAEQAIAKAEQDKRHTPKP